MVYTGRLTVRAMKLGCADQIRNLVEWCETFFRENYLEQWIGANGGWVSDCINRLKAVTIWYRYCRSKIVCFLTQLMYLE